MCFSFLEGVYTQENRYNFYKLDEDLEIFFKKTDYCFFVFKLRWDQNFSRISSLWGKVQP